MASKMADQENTAVDTMLDNMRKLRDGKLPIVDACYTVGDLLGRDLKATVNAVVETADNFFKNRKLYVINKGLDQLSAFTCASACFALVKSFQNHVLHLLQEIDVQEHNQRIEQIRTTLKVVADKLNKISGKIEEMGVMLKEKILLYKENENPGIYIEFDLNFDLITNDLNTCEELLNNAKKDLEEGFSSVKKYLKNCVAAHVVAGAAIAVPAGVVIIAAATYLLPVVGCCLAIATGAIALGGLAYLTYKLCSAIKSALGIREQYQHLERETVSLEKQLKGFRGQMESFGNARKRHEAEHKNTVLEADNLKYQEEIKRLREQLAARNSQMQ